MLQLNNVDRFVDAHVHLRGQQAIDSVLSSGIAAVRNAGLRPDGKDPGCRHYDKPIVLSSCWALYKSGGYGGRFGVPVITRQDIKAEIGKLKKAGADIIKVMASGMVSFAKPGTVTAGGFDKDELKFITEEAGANGLRVMAHANAEQAIKAAAEAGVLSIEHGFFMTPGALESMANNGVYWTPTAGALMRAAKKDGTGATEEFASDLIRHHLLMIKTAYDLEVPLAVGTDCMLPDPGYRAAYEAELGYFEEAGILRDEVIRIATEGGARLLRISC